MSPPTPSPSSEPNPLAEYEVLGRELDQRRRLRIRIFVGATGIVLVLIAATFVLGPTNLDTEPARLALIYAAHAVVVAALLATHRLTHRIDFTAGYLRAIVEPQVQVAPDSAGLPPRRRRRALESARALGACYALLVSAIVAAGIANSLYRTMWAVGLPVLALVGVLNANLLFMSAPSGPRPRAPRDA